jgi:hypothetical protein
MRKFALIFLLLALTACSDADEYTALVGCKIERMKNAPQSDEGEYLTSCMWLKGYQFVTEPPCGGPVTYALSTCYQPATFFARIRRNLFGNKPPFAR